MAKVTDIEDLKSAIITVGGGRGFVVEGTCERRGVEGEVYRFPRRYVITAAHCLPFFPPCISASFNEERTYQGLLAPLGQKPAVSTECVFVDPVADIAVLGSPDNQTFCEQADAYEELVDAVSPLLISDAPERGPAWLLSLTGELIPCVVDNAGGPLWIEDTPPGKYGGMSGSPIIAADGSAIGVFVIGRGDGSVGVEETGNGGPSPRLTYHLPGWLLHDLGAGAFITGREENDNV
jgi:hypothetical protein